MSSTSPGVVVVPSSIYPGGSLLPSGSGSVLVEEEGALPQAPAGWVLNLWDPVPNDDIKKRLPHIIGQDRLDLADEHYIAVHAGQRQRIALFSIHGHPTFIQHSVNDREAEGNAKDYALNVGRKGVMGALRGAMYAVEMKLEGEDLNAALTRDPKAPYESNLNYTLGANPTAPTHTPNASRLRFLLNNKIQALVLWYEVISGWTLTWGVYMLIDLYRKGKLTPQAAHWAAKLLREGMPCINVVRRRTPRDVLIWLRGVGNDFHDGQGFTCIEAVHLTIKGEQHWQIVRSDKGIKSNQMSTSEYEALHKECIEEKYDPRDHYGPKFQRYLDALRLRGDLEAVDLYNPWRFVMQAKIHVRSKELDMKTFFAINRDAYAMFLSEEHTRIWPVEDSHLGYVKLM